MFRVNYKKQALKALLKIPRNRSSQIKEAISGLAKDGEHINSKKLQGRDGYRLRVGYRFLYIKNENELVILIVNIGSRGEVYK